MTIKGIILGGAGAAALLFGSLLGPTVSATAQPAPGSGSSPDPTCLSLGQQLRSDQILFHQWVTQRAIDARRGLDTSFDSSQIAFYEAQVNQDSQLLHDLGC
jgi:hypothetical protein